MGIPSASQFILIDSGSRIRDTIGHIVHQCHHTRTCTLALLIWTMLCRIVQHADGRDWVLGSGATGTVLKGVRGDVQPVAVKVMRRADRETEQDFVREIAMMKCEALNPLKVMAHYTSDVVNIHIS